MQFMHILSQDWWEIGPDSQVRTFAGEIPNPFKQKVSPLRNIPGCKNPTMIQPDIMHCFNLGFGKDLAGSAVMLLCRLDIFPGNSIGEKLDAAYQDFNSWCKINKRTTFLKKFELKTFKITSIQACMLTPNLCPQPMLYYQLIRV